MDVKKNVAKSVDVPDISDDDSEVERPTHERHEEDQQRNGQLQISGFEPTTFSMRVFSHNH